MIAATAQTMTPSTEAAAQAARLDLRKLNQRFEKASPKGILTWCIENFPIGLVQVSGFNVDDLLITDLLYRALQPARSVPVLFLNTLHHFPQTLELVAATTAIYNLDLHVYQPAQVNSRQDFATKYGEALWEVDLAHFQQLTKLQPLQQGLAELDAIAWITSRRRDQSAAAADMPIFERDPQQRLKINPLANWTRKETWAYVYEHDVIYNPLHDQGYPTIGDEPLTIGKDEAEGQSAQRWCDTPF